MDWSQGLLKVLIKMVFHTLTFKHVIIHLLRKQPIRTEYSRVGVVAPSCRQVTQSGSLIKVRYILVNEDLNPQFDWLYNRTEPVTSLSRGMY